MDTQTIATTDQPKVHKGRGSKLTQEQLVAILKLAKLNKTQVEIAQAVGCDQGTVSRWLSQCEDSTEQAGTYLRGSALRMAKNIVDKGLARDHIAALKGIGVLADDTPGQGVVIQIGIKDSDVTFASQTSTVSSDKP